MTVCTWFTSDRPSGNSFHKPEQRTGTRGTYNKCFAVDIEQKPKTLFVTVAASSMKECIAEFRHTAASIDIPVENWGKFDIPLTENAIRAVKAWAGAVRSTITESRKQAPADSPDAL